jgi:adenosine/AMP kinase
VRSSGNDPELTNLAARSVLAPGAGHGVIVFLREGRPVNVLKQVSAVSEVCLIPRATATR